MNCVCANCGCSLNDHHVTTGESGLYNHGDGVSYLLCEPCFFEEEAAIDEHGTNDLPKRRAHYERNQPGGFR